MADKLTKMMDKLTKGWKTNTLADKLTKNDGQTYKMADKLGGVVYHKK